MLTLHQLEVLVTVADVGSVRGAAERLVVTQPAVSASIAALEKQVGVKLVERSGRGIALTDEGTAMAGYARRILSLAHEAMTVVKEGEDGAGALHLGVGLALAQHLTGALLAGVNELQPRVSVELEVGHQVKIWGMLMSRELDIAVTGRPPGSGGFCVLAERANEMIVVCRPGSVWHDGLTEATWLVREPGSGTRACAEDVIARLGIDPRRVVVGSNMAIQTAAEAGVGVALLPAEAVSGALSARTLARLAAPGTPMAHPWCVVAREGEPLARPARMWLDQLLESADAAFTSTPAGG